MRLRICFGAAALCGAAGLCLADPPTGPIVRNPFYDAVPAPPAAAPAPGEWRSAMHVGSPQAAAATAPELEPAPIVVANTNFVANSAMPLVGTASRASSTMVGGNRYAAQQAEPGRFVPPDNAVALAAVAQRAPQADPAVQPAVYHDMVAASSPGKFLSAAIDAQLEVTRLAANPLREGELPATLRITTVQSPDGANPLR